MKKTLLLITVLVFIAGQAFAANITMSTLGGSSTTMGSPTYTVILDLVAAADGTGCGACRKYRSQQAAPGRS